jgi:YesN/AraC family two-component response regulator
MGKNGASLLFPSERFAVILIFFESFGVFAPDGAEKGEMDLARYSVKNVFLEIIEKTGAKAYFSDNAEILTALLALPEDALKVQNEIKTLTSACGEIQAIIKEILEIKASFSVSSVVRGIENAPNAYREAHKIAEYKYSRDEEFVLSPENAPNTKSEKISELVKRVIKYIDEGYSDADLSIGKIAESLDIHPNYLSNVFKEQTGAGALEYINKVRVERSRALLRETELRLAKIAEETGFLNVNTYVRVFKKFTAETPGAYRKRMELTPDGE